MKPRHSFLPLSFSICIALAPCSAQATELMATDGSANDLFGYSVSISGTMGFIGAYGNNASTGTAYIFRNLNSYDPGDIYQNNSIDFSGQTGLSGGYSVSLSGNTGLVGVLYEDIGANADQGAAYAFRNLDPGSSITQVKLVASDGAAGDRFGIAVAASGNYGLVGAWANNPGGVTDQGAAYFYRNITTTTGTITQNTKLTASDGATSDLFGRAVSLSGATGLVGSYHDDIGSNTDQGSAYVFRGLDSAGATKTQNAKLIASDGATNDRLGYSVSISGNSGLAGAFGKNNDQGAAYLFRNLDTVTGTQTQNAKLTASDGVALDRFAWSVSLSGNNGLVGAYGADIGGNTNQGAAYLFRNLNTATGTVTQNLKITASNGLSGDEFGSAVSLDGDGFIIGADYGDGAATNSGKAYYGTVSSMTTLDAGNTGRWISDLSFISQDDWIVGQTTDNNEVILGSGTSANVTASGKGVYVGKNAGSDGNMLVIAGSLSANSLTVGDAGGGQLLLSGGSISSASSYVGKAAGSVGTATVNSGSWSNSFILQVGESGSGSLTINGGTVSGQYGHIGASAGSTGTAIVSGGSWNSSADFNVGVMGNGTLTINGGTVSDSVGVIGDGGASVGNATVSSGSWSNASALYIGRSATGTLNLTGTGTVSVTSGSGTVTVARDASATGTLNIGTGGIAGTLNAAVVNGGSGNATVNFNHTGNVTFAPQLTGSLKVNKLGAGTTILSGNNSYTGLTTISGGTLKVTSLSDYGVNGSLGARTSGQESGANIGILFRGGTLQYTGSTAQSTNRQIRISTIGGGTIDASGSNPSATMNFTFSGTNTDLYENPGSRTLTLTGSNTGDNTFAIRLTDQDVINNNRTSLIKSGTGKWVLTGSSTYTGPTTVNQGTLAVNGNISTSITTVNNGGTLGGSGTVGAVTVMSGGTLAPGNSIESLATGNLTLSGGSTFAHEINNDAAPGVAGDLTAVTGTLTLSLLNDANLTLTELGSGSWNYGEKLTLISYSGAWNGGLFKLDGNTLADDSTFNFSGMDWTFNYNDTTAGSNWTGDLTGSSFVTMTAVPEPASMLLLGCGSLFLLRRRRDCAPVNQCRRQFQARRR